MKYNILVLILASILIYSCQKDFTEAGSNEGPDAQLQKKWLVTTSNVLKIKSIELTEGRLFLMTDSSGDIILEDSYTSSADGKTIILGNYGSILVKDVSEKDLTFVFQISSVNLTPNLNAKVAPVIDKLPITDSLTHYWEANRRVMPGLVGGTYDTLNLPPTDTSYFGLYKRGFVYTKYGTNIVRSISKDGNDYDTSYYSRLWNWETGARTDLYHTEIDDTSNHIILKVVELSKSKLTLKDNNADETYYSKR